MPTMIEIVERLLDQWMVLAGIGAGFALGFGACMATAVFQELRARQQLSESRRLAFISAIERDRALIEEAKASVARYDQIVEAEKDAAMEWRRHLQDGLMGRSHMSDD